jgi:hypothetical protein
MQSSGGGSTSNLVDGSGRMFVSVVIPSCWCKAVGLRVLMRGAEITEVGVHWFERQGWAVQIAVLCDMLTAQAASCTEEGMGKQ